MQYNMKENILIHFKNL